MNTVYDGYNIHAGGLNFERPIDAEKLASKVTALFHVPSTTLDISVRKFKVLLNLIKILLSMPDAPLETDTTLCVVSDEEWKRLTKTVMYKLFHGWPGERVDALYIIFKCLCIQKGLLDG